MPEKPTFGRYAEIPYDQMTPEQQEGYRSLIETRGQLGGPSRIWVHNPKLAKVMGPLGAYFRTGRNIVEGEGHRHAGVKAHQADHVGNALVAECFDCAIEEALRHPARIGEARRHLVDDLLARIGE